MGARLEALQQESNALRAALAEHSLASDEKIELGQLQWALMQARASPNPIPNPNPNPNPSPSPSLSPSPSPNPYRLARRRVPSGGAAAAQVRRLLE